MKLAWYVIFLGVGFYFGILTENTINKKNDIETLIKLRSCRDTNATLDKLIREVYVLDAINGE